jgi:hypothetical protein
MREETPTMNPLARKLIQQRYLDRGTSTRMVVLPLPGCGLPEGLVDAAQPVTLDLLVGRPVNLELDDESLWADLCFSGPPVRCCFPWSGIAAVQGPDDTLVETLAVAIAVVMEDGGLSLASPLPTDLPESTAPAEEPTPQMVAIPGRAMGRPRTKGAAKLRLVGHDDGDDS